MSNYITEIKINKVRHLENLSINLGDEKKHLILTGKNGSGKTSVLEELDNLLLVEPLQLISFGEPTYTDIPNVSINHEYDNQEYFYAYFSAKRTSNTMQKPNGIEKIELSKIKDKKLNTYFLKYIVALKAERSFAKDDNDEEIVKKIDSWFNTFEEMLRQIFNDDSLQLQFDRRNIMSYNFLIKRSNREPFDFTTLSDGYSAIIDIVTEILLKIETTESKSFDVEGIVLIDEVEAHLHVEMQKHIMRLLTEFFPKIQFIITTHSPFVLQSIENSVVYDLERKEQLSSDALHDASYTQIVKNYFKVDSEYSHLLEADITKYRDLIQKFETDTLTVDEEKELLDLDMKLDKTTPMLSDTIYLKFKELQDRIRSD